MTDEEILKAFECCCGDDVNGTHCKDCPAEKYNFDWCSDEVSRQMVDYTKRLQSENADLRERLEKAVELPLKVGSTVYIIHETDEEDKFNPWIDTGRIETFSFDVKLWIFVRYNSGLTMWYSKDTFDKEVCLTLEAAEARLRELQGEKQ